ncbi:MAG: EF-hand domain-containing protein [Caldilineaceae bacterium]
MLTALQTRKLTRAFSLFDVDRNGFMEGADCELVVSATTQAMGYALGSPEYEQYRSEYMAGWDNLVQLGDSDGDQRLTVAEFCTAYDKMMANRKQFGVVIMGSSRRLLRCGTATKTAKCPQRNTAPI